MNQNNKPIIYLSVSVAVLFVLVLFLLYLNFFKKPVIVGIPDLTHPNPIVSSVPTIIPSPEPSVIQATPTVLPSSVPATSVPSSISSIFSALNSGLKSNLVPTALTTFYSPTGDTEKKPSWKLDFPNSLITDKSQMNIINHVLTTSLTITNNGGGAGPNSFQEYVNSQVDCYFFTGNTGTGGPESWTPDKEYQYLQCAEK